MNAISGEYADFLRKLITPNHICHGLDDLDVELLYQEGYRTLFLDVDNTLISYTQRVVSLQLTQWVESAKSIGFEIFLVSNNSSQRRIERVALQLEVKGLYFAMKPLAYSVRELAKDYRINLNKSVFVGDKILADVVLGNWVGAYSVLVDPMDKRLSLLRTIQRDIEMYFINKLASSSKK